MKLNVPLAVGVPVAGLGVKEALAGKLVAVRVTTSPSGSVAETVKVRLSPAFNVRLTPPCTVTVGQLLGGGSATMLICTMMGTAVPLPQPALSVAVKLALTV